MLKLDSKTLAELTQKRVKKIKIFFYTAGCSGTKLDIILDDFEVDEHLESITLEQPVGFDIYIEKTDAYKFANATITRLVKADHTGEEKVRYIYSSGEVQERCGCGTSFAFEKKQPKFDFIKLQNLKQEFSKK